MNVLHLQYHRLVPVNIPCIYLYRSVQLMEKCAIFLTYAKHSALILPVYSGIDSSVCVGLDAMVATVLLVIHVRGGVQAWQRNHNGCTVTMRV